MLCKTALHDDGAQGTRTAYIKDDKSRIPGPLDDCMRSYSGAGDENCTDHSGKHDTLDE